MSDSQNYPQIALEGEEIVVRISLTGDRHPSKSGKTQIVASTYGVARLLTPQGEVRLNLTAFEAI